jgi:hypothetical protein
MVAGAGGSYDRNVSIASEAVSLRHRFATSMIDCRAAAQAYPGDFAAQLGSLYRRLLGPVAEDAAVLRGEPWLSEFLKLTSAEQLRTLQVARKQTD